MSGIGWYGDLGNFLVMPTIGKLHTNKGHEDFPEKGYRSRFSHDDEIAEAATAKSLPLNIQNTKYFKFKS